MIHNENNDERRTPHICVIWSKRPRHTSHIFFGYILEPKTESLNLKSFRRSSHTEIHKKNRRFEEDSSKLHLVSFTPMRAHSSSRAQHIGSECVRASWAEFHFLRRREMRSIHPCNISKLLFSRSLIQTRAISFTLNSRKQNQKQSEKKKKSSSMNL